ncbi:unnamed protein product [Protopolystoma xenopodis]|uniref:Uncharacterized protein n=1 Tax=Protopolystoma xenopodis TaxID=117903 RepID=A0A3S4ZXP5_9PLAT|nr:unnamed protein product [Protopolystoma xenopodis]
MLSEAVGHNPRIPSLPYTALVPRLHEPTPVSWDLASPSSIYHSLARLTWRRAWARIASSSSRLDISAQLETRAASALSSAFKILNTFINTYTHAHTHNKGEIWTTGSSGAGGKLASVDSVYTPGTAVSHFSDKISGLPASQREQHKPTECAKWGGQRRGRKKSLGSGKKGKRTPHGRTRRAEFAHFPRFLGSPSTSRRVTGATQRPLSCLHQCPPLSSPSLPTPPQVGFLYPSPRERQSSESDMQYLRPCPHATCFTPLARTIAGLFIPLLFSPILTSSTPTVLYPFFAHTSSRQFDLASGTFSACMVLFVMICLALEQPSRYQVGPAKWARFFVVEGSCTMSL